MSIPSTSSSSSLPATTTTPHQTIFVFAVAAALSLQPPPQQKRKGMVPVQIERASDAQVTMARQILLQEKMNPLFISKQHLLVATTTTTTPDDTKTTKGNNNAAGPQQSQLSSSSSSSSLSSIPLSDGVMVGFGQIRPIDDMYSELASLYVVPQYRRQGIASQLISTLLRRHDDETRMIMSRADKETTTLSQSVSNGKIVCLLTLRPTAPLYERHGFQIVDGEPSLLPPSVQMEYKAGSIISKFLGNDLIAMIRRTTTTATTTTAATVSPELPKL